MVQGGEEGLLEGLALFNRYGMLLITDTPPTYASTCRGLRGLQQRLPCARARVRLLRQNGGHGSVCTPRRSSAQHFLRRHVGHCASGARLAAAAGRGWLAG